MSLFRKTALEYHAAQKVEGDILRFDLRWLTWTHRIVVLMALTGILFIVVFDVNEYATGTSFVRVEGRRTLTAIHGGTVESVLVQPGEHVTKGQVLVTLQVSADEVERRRASSEFNLHLAQVLRDPSDANAKQQLASLRGRRDQARELARSRFVRAPEDGVITDVRTRPGQHLEPREVVLGLAPPNAEASLVCVLPGDYRPSLKPGQDIRFALDGYKFEYRTVTVESVGEEVVGPVEMRRFVGAEIADAFPIQGPSVLVKGRLPTRTFTVDGQTFTYVEGLTGRASVRVRKEPILLVLLPALKALRT